MKFSAHYLTTYIPELDGPEPDFFEHLFEQFALLDELGFHQAWVTEHHFHEYGGTIPDPATFLAAAAVHTRRLRLGVAISVLPLHHPLKIAESYAMVDAISHGRLDFGVGRGNSELEQQQFGIDYAESPDDLRKAPRSFARHGRSRPLASRDSTTHMTTYGSCPVPPSDPIRRSGWRPTEATTPTAGLVSKAVTYWCCRTCTSRPFCARPLIRIKRDSSGQGLHRPHARCSAVCTCT